MTKIKPYQIDKQFWEEIGRSTLASTSDTLSVSSLPARRYLRLQIMLIASGSIAPELRFNGDSGNNYAWRIDTNGANGSGASSNALFIDAGVGTNTFAVVDIINILAQEKLVVAHTLAQGTAGAANVPHLRLGAGKWANTSALISLVSCSNAGVGADYLAGTELVVLGHD